MTIPTEYQDNADVVGSSNITHPIITFKLKLDLLKSEKMGPNTNSSTVAILHPDMHNEPDRGRESLAARSPQISAFISGHLSGENIVRADDETFVAYGTKALYLKNNFTSGDTAWLEVVSNTFASE